MKTNNEADLEDSKPPDKEQESNPPPAKRPRRKAALKSEERTAEIAVECDTKESPVAKRPRRKKAALKSEEADDNASKKKRCESAPIPVDAMVNVMEFLPPRSLYNIALTCKPLREMVTVKMVVQSALIHGGNPKKTMEELYALMRAHSMHIPSPLRLLRLVNSKTCEFCLTSGTNVRVVLILLVFIAALKNTHIIYTIRCSMSAQALAYLHVGIVLAVITTVGVGAINEAVERN